MLLLLQLPVHDYFVYFKIEFIEIEAEQEIVNM
jgi:hypothetical protein